MRVIDFIRTQYTENGHVAYGEHISMTNHMLQSAFYAEQAGSSKEVVVAAFLHDIGHLLHGLPEDISDHGIDGFHEDIGERCLKGYLPTLVTDCIRLHVQAKRYMCTLKPAYYEKLTGASRESLAIQGGLMSDQEVAAFESEPYYKEAMRVRVYDDMGKQAELEHPDLDYYLKLTEECLVITEMSALDNTLTA